MGEMTETFCMLEEITEIPLEELPYEAWLDRLKAQEDDDPLHPLLPMLEEKVYDNRCRWEMYEKMPIYDTENLKWHLLAPCPPLDRDAFKKFLFNLGLI